MPAITGTDLGHLCPLQRGDARRELPRDQWRSRLSPAYSTRRSGCGIGHSEDGGMTRQDNRDRELAVMQGQEPGGNRVRTSDARAV
jgi:hypothetical protein